MEKASKFNEWMKCRIQSIHYSNNEKMLNAFNKLIDEKV